MIDNQAIGDNYRVCENCGEKMNEFRCKLVCDKCGNFRSCSDLF